MENKEELEEKELLEKIGETSKIYENNYNLAREKVLNEDEDE